MQQEEKFRIFKALHHTGNPFVVANPWDAGSARILTTLGFSALATTSAGCAFAAGVRDSQGGLSRAEILANASAIVDATDLPVSADLEDGFGPAPETVPETIRQAINCGLVGGSIEDATGNSATPIFEAGEAKDRVAAAVEAASGHPFVLTARAENYLWGRPDLGDTIARLQSFAEAGADVLYAPGLPDIQAIRTVCAELDKPVNVVMGLSGAGFSVDELGAAGVARISVGGSFARAALGAMMRAAQEVMEQGTFTYAADAISNADAQQMMSDAKPGSRI